MSPVLVNSFRVVSPAAPTTPSQMIFGYIEGDFTTKKAAGESAWSLFDGVIDRAETACPGTPGSSPVEAGYDFSWAHPSGLKIDKLEIWGSNTVGYISGISPTDLKLTLYGWVSSWTAIGDTGEFTDVNNANPKTIFSTDTTTLFTRFKVILTWTGGFTARIAQLKIYEVGVGQIALNLLDGINVGPNGIGVNSLWGRGEQIFDGSGNDILANNLLTNGATTSDFTIPLLFDKSRPVDKVVVFSGSDAGFHQQSDPTDMQIDLEGWNGSAWVALGDTGTFTDANNTTKTINSSDTTTLFSKIRIVISTATSGHRVLSEVEVHVFV